MISIPHGPRRITGACTGNRCRKLLALRAEVDMRSATREDFEAFGSWEAPNSVANNWRSNDQDKE
jgi:hypothetical protein